MTRHHKNTSCPDSVKTDEFKGWVKAQAFGTQRGAPWRKRTRFNVVFDIARDKSLDAMTCRLCILIYTRMSNGRTKAQIPRKWLKDHCGMKSTDTFYERRTKLIEAGWITVTPKFSEKGIEASLYEFYERADGPLKKRPTPCPQNLTMDTSGTTYLLSEATPKEVAL